MRCEVYIKYILIQSSDMQTEPPPRANFCETVNQWVIYDSYVAYETAKELAEEKEMKKEQKEVKSMRRRLLETPKESSNDEVNKRMLRAAKILERMVNQNTYDEIAQGFNVPMYIRDMINLLIYFHQYPLPHQLELHNNNLEQFINIPSPPLVLDNINK